MDQKGAVYVAVSAQRQKAALNFFIDNIFNTPQWLLNEEIATKLSKATLHNKVSAMQSRGLNRILSSSRLNRMTDYQNESGYSLENMILGLSEGLFNINNPDKLERNIQAQFISQLHQLTTKESKAKPARE